jgi:hypothetical protein
MVGRRRRKINGGWANLQPLMIKVAMASPPLLGFGFDSAGFPFVFPYGPIHSLAPLLAPTENIFCPPPNGAGAELHLGWKLTCLHQSPPRTFGKTGFFSNLRFTPNEIVPHAKHLLSSLVKTDQNV